MTQDRRRRRWSTTGVLVGYWLSRHASSLGDLGLPRAESIHVVHVVAANEIAVFFDINQDKNHVRVDGPGLERRGVVAEPGECLLGNG